MIFRSRSQGCMRGFDLEPDKFQGEVALVGKPPEGFGDVGGAASA